MLGLLGILLLVVVIPVPGSKEKPETYIENTNMQELVGVEEPMEIQLKKVLEKISGVGSVEVFISYQDKGMMVLEKDESVSEELVQEADGSGGTRTTTTRRNERETVYDRDETPYVVRELTPAIEGVLVVAQGAGNVSVKNQIRETIEALFGLEEHKISIMKMEVSK